MIESPSPGQPLLAHKANRIAINQVPIFVPMSYPEPLGFGKQGWIKLSDLNGVGMSESFLPGSGMKRRKTLCQQRNGLNDDESRADENDRLTQGCGCRCMPRIGSGIPRKETAGIRKQAGQGMSPS